MTLATQPKSMIIVGSGAIGVEFAHFYTILWTGNHCRIYAKYSSVEDEDISKQMERSLKKGIKIMTNSSVENWYFWDRCKAFVKTAKGRSSEAEILLSLLESKPTLKTLD
jgi:dihydrolipoamide dehydrogenase